MKQLAKTAGNERSCALVADDDDDARALLASVLRRAGFEVAEAADGDELIEVFERMRVQRKGPDGEGALSIVVSDIGMPGRDGLEATRLLRQASPELPIVLVTAFSDGCTFRSAHAAGAAAVIPKPIDSGRLIQTVIALSSRPLT